MPDYGRIYGQLIAARRSAPPSGYSELHHIVPRFEGGSDDAANLVRLSARDHIFAHLLLAKWKGGKHWIAVHWTFVSIGKSGRLPTAQEVRIAAKAREIWAERSKGLLAGEKHPMFGKTHSEETRQKISAARKRQVEPRTGKRHSIATKQKISEATKRGLFSPETRQKISEAMKRHMSDPKNRERMRRANIGNKNYRGGLRSE